MRRVGGTKDIDLDVRIIIASNEPLWEASKKGKFREDLYHRFNEFSMTFLHYVKGKRILWYLPGIFSRSPMRN